MVEHDGSRLNRATFVSIEPSSDSRNVATRRRCKGSRDARSFALSATCNSRSAVGRSLQCRSSTMTTTGPSAERRSSASPSRSLMRSPSASAVSGGGAVGHEDMKRTRGSKAGVSRHHRARCERSSGNTEPARGAYGSASPSMQRAVSTRRGDSRGRHAQVTYERGLSDARFAGDEHDPRLTGTGVLESCLEPGAFVLATDRRASRRTHSGMLTKRRPLLTDLSADGTIACLVPTRQERTGARVCKTTSLHE